MIFKKTLKAQMIQSLDLNQKYEFEFPNGNVFHVTLFDANHCPGAVMFFFEGDFGKILVTGIQFLFIYLLKSKILNEIQ